MISGLWCYYWNCFRVPWSMQYKTAHLIDKCCVCFDCSTDQLFLISLPLLRPPCSLWYNNTEIKSINNPIGFPRWLGGKESACQSRRHALDPWSRKIPHAPEQLTLCTAAIEPVLWSWRAALLKPTCPRAGVLQQEKSRQREACSLQLESRIWSPQLEKSPGNNKDLAQPTEINK